MAESLGEAVLALKTDDSGLDKGIQRAEQKTDALAAKFERTGQNMRGIGTKLSVALTAPLTAFAATAIPAAVESQQALAQVDAALNSMGPVAGRTSAQLQKLAGDLQNISLFDDDDILKSVSANLLTFGNISDTAFDRAQLAATNLSARLGQDLQSSAIQVGKALNDPVKGVTALTRVCVSFTAAQKEQIKAMASVGDMAGAQSIILGELEKQFGGAAKAQRDATPNAAMEQQWRSFQEVTGGIALTVLPKLTGALTSVLAGFNNLSPGTQTFIVGGAAAAAALGPLLFGLGAMLPLLATVGGSLVLTTAGLFGFAVSEAAAATGSFALGTALRAAGTSFLTFATGALSAAIPAIGSLLIALAPILIPLAAVTAAVGLVYLAWKNWDQIKPYIDAVGAAISGWWNANVQPILTLVGDKVKAVVALFEEYFGGHIANVVKLVSALFNGDFKGAWEAMKNIVTGAINGALKIFQTFAPNVFRALKSLAQNLVTVGRDIIAGLVSGISANAAAVWNALKNVVLAGVNNVKAFLGIKSPSRVFHEIGGNITDGLAEGIIGGIPDVDEAMGQLAKAVADAAPQWTVDINGGPTPIGLPNIEGVGGERADSAQSDGTPDNESGSGDGPAAQTPEVEAQWREGFQRTFAEGVRAALDGDLGGFMKNFLSNIAERAFTDGLNAVSDFLGSLLQSVFGDSGGGGSGGSLGEGLGGLLSSIFAGGYSTGGMIPLGKFGVVGENGPEPVISTSRGALVRPNRTLSAGALRPSGTQVHMPISINAPGADAAALDRVRQSLDQLRTDLPGITLRTVQDAGERGMVNTGDWR